MQTWNIPEISEIQFVGYNDKDAIHLLPKGYFVKANNCFVTDNKITKVFGSTLVAPSIATYPFNGLVSFERYAAGTKYLVANINGASNAQLYSWNGSGSFSAIGSANLTNSKPMNFCIATDTLFGFNGTECVTWDGTTYTKNPTSVPIGNFASWFHGYLWVGNSSSQPNRLWWSNLGQPKSFAGAVTTVAINNAGVNYSVGDTLTLTSTNNVSGIGAKVYVTSISGTTLSSASDTWTLGSGWTGSYGAGFVHSSGTATVTDTTVVPVAGYNYQITYTVTGRTAGSFTLQFGGITSASFTASGNWETMAQGDGTFTMTPTTDFNGTVILSIQSDDNTGPITGVSLLLGGSGYSTSTGITTTGGNGAGATFDITGVNTTDSINYVDVNAGDSDQITGMSYIQDELLIFKRNTIWSVAGWAADSFSSTTLTPSNMNARIFGYGAINNGSIVSVGNDVYYFSLMDGEIPVIRSLKKTINAVTLAGGVVSDAISGTLGTVNLNAVSKITACFDGRYIYWAIPTNGSSTNNEIIAMDTWKLNSKKGVYPFISMTGKNVSYFANSTISGGSSTVFYTDATSTGNVFKFDPTVYSDNGTPITMEVITRGYMGHPSRKTHWKYLKIKYGQGVNSTLHVSSRFDAVISWTEQFGSGGVAPSLMGTSPGLGPTGMFTLGVSTLGGAQIGYNRINFAQQVGQIFQIQYLETSAEPVTIYESTLYGNVKGIRQ